MQPTTHTPVSTQVMLSIIQRHRLQVRSFSLRPWVGGGSCVYQLEDTSVLKVPHDDPAPITSIAIEAAAAVHAHAAGVRTPRLIAFDDSLDLLPVPYLVYERVHGEPLPQIGRSPATVRRIWREVGGDLARLHTRVGLDMSLRPLPKHEQSPDTDPRPWVENLHRAGDLTDAEACWLGDVLDRLAPATLAPLSLCFCHGDVNAGNVMVGHREPRTYAALLDWGGAGWADPASDFSGIALEFVPSVLRGHREIALLEDDDTAEVRVLWFYLRLALFGLNRNVTTESERARRIERLLGDTGAFLHRAQLA